MSPETELNKDSKEIEKPINKYQLPPREEVTLNKVTSQPLSVVPVVTKAHPLFGKLIDRFNNYKPEDNLNKA